jgi:hypothetical protein
MLFSALLVLGGLGLAPQTPSPAVPPPPPPPPVVQPAPAAPAPTVPPPPPPPVQATPAVAVPAPGPKVKGEPPKFAFTLGNKSENIVPCKHGSAATDEGKVEITPEDNVLKTVLTGGAGANVFLGAESTATHTLQVVQEFDITCSDPRVTEVVLTLESNLAGIIRSKHKASACVRLASARISPVGWASAPLGVCYPTLCVTGAQGYKYSEPAEPVKAPPLPLGHYVLQADFIVQATASGFLDAHSTAIFAPTSEAIDALEREHDPLKDEKHDDFGFSLTLKADSPPGFPPVARKKASKRVSSRPASYPTR